MLREAQEARHVNKPRSPPSKLGRGARRFFLDLSTSFEDEPGASSPESRKHAEWWDVDEALETPAAAMQPPPLDLGLPEHLPSSPLCPLNPKNSTGGMGICVYHGRRTTKELLEEK
jgi:hypothetical protein